MIVCSIASASASSVPGRSCSHRSASFARRVRRGSTTITFGWLASDSSALNRVSPSGPEFTGLCPQYTMHFGGVPPVKSLTGRSPNVRMVVLMRGWKHCANPGSHQFGVPSACPKRDTQRMWCRPVPVPNAMASAP